MDEIERLLRRQAAWQAGRRRLSWPAKVRMVEAIREDIARLRQTASAGSPVTTTGKGLSSRPGKPFRPQGRKRRGV